MKSNEFISGTEWGIQMNKRLTRPYIQRLLAVLHLYSGLTVHFEYNNGTFYETQSFFLE